jgi:hypothetical protein
MISFRYHIVTIVAVFVALGAGILLGGTFFDTVLANQLQQQVRAQGAKLDHAESQVADLESQLASIQQLGSIYLPTIVANRLTGVPTVLVTVQDVDLAALKAARQALVQAGVSSDLITIQLRDRLGSTNPVDQSALAQAIGLPAATPPPTDIAGQAVSALAERLLQAPPAGTVDLLQDLRAGSFIQIVGQASLDTVGVPGQAVAIVAGQTATTQADPTGFVLPLITDLVGRDPPTPVVVGEPSTTTDTLLPQIRTGDLSGKLVTVDDVEEVVGQVSFAVGLERLVQNPGQGANYGRGEGASAPFPVP